MNRSGILEHFFHPSETTGWLPLPTLLMLVALTAAFYLSPLALLLVACLCAGMALDARFKWFFVLAACLLFTLLNATKELSGDLVSYVSLQEYISNRPITILLSQAELREITGSYRITELGFYVPLWLLSQVFSDHQIVIAVGATLGIFVPTFAALHLIARTERWSDRLTIVVALFAFFASINFIQTTHVLRQYMSSSVAFLAFALFLSGATRRAAIVVLLACTVHNATAVPVANIIVFEALFRPGTVRALSAGQLVVRTLCMTGILALSFGGILLSELNDVLASVAEISAWRFPLALGVMAVFAAVVRFDGQRSPLNSYLFGVFAVVFTLSAGFYLAGVHLLALRGFFYLEWLYPLMLVGVLRAIPQSRPSLFLACQWAVSMLATFVFLLRIDRSPWQYGPGGLQLLTSDLPTVLGYLAN